MNSISGIQKFKNCPLSYKLHSIVGLRKIEDEAADHHRIFGAAMHKAMEVIYRARLSYDAERREARPIVTPGLASLAKKAFLDAYPRQLDPADNAKTRETGVYAIDSYLRKYATEDARRWRILAVESPERYDNGFITHLDMVAENLETGGVYGFDFKHTKKELKYTFWRQFEPNSQIARYADFIASKYGSCEGFYIRATQFGYRSRKSVNGPAGFYVNHEAQLFNVNQDKIDMERASSRYWQRLIKRLSEDERLGLLTVWGMNTDHCQWCQYRPICSNGWTWEQDRELILNRYRLACNQLTPNLRTCELEPGHTGPHTEERPLEQDEMTIEVEL